MLTAVPSRSVPDRLRHKTVAAAVAESLRQRILTGEFPAGTQLRQDALAEEFGISRIPIREALLQLEATGLIKIMPHRGAVVSGLSVEEVEDIFALRVRLEPELLALSAPRLSEQDLQGLRDLTEEYGTALEAGEILRWGELNQRFHLDLLRHAGRPRSLTIVASLLQDCDRPTRLQLSASGDVARADREHREILALCEAGRFDRAADHLRRHIEFAAQSLIAIYRRALTP
ncbi:MULTISPECIES: GntR family transcriptional regulator [unclassified Methylobacterium]|uniref:GntR family transcriptional regulator n=1 Tax=unclassified Methylobacterium TaxID=2615210 RepID=UPI0011C1E1CB|nr:MULTISPECIES: GntR family transcriptional regulator [unclassified Methylobacterium]QEE40894.1 GntR family transcriptional regulator [Methylobacterium sp. WL1]TXN01656.1 GntR family transcriptional regulator [Methylobacterium sp. WL64]TXN51419.1 GntR family transcriptional regulator [Methylobacterium sp. WL2]